MIFSIDQNFYPFVYSLGGVILGICTIIIFIFRKDLRKLILLMAVVLLPFASIAEYLFFKDYWFPPDFVDFNLLGIRVISGDLVMVMTAPPLFVVGVMFLFRLTIKGIEGLNYRLLGLKIIFLQIILTSIFFGIWYLTDLNSIFCYILASIILSVLILSRNTELIKWYLVSVMVMGALTFLFYLAYQVVIGDQYLRDVWILDHAMYSINVIGVTIPLTEVLFGAFAAPFYMLLPFFANKDIELVKLHRSN